MTLRPHKLYVVKLMMFVLAVASVVAVLGMGKSGGTVDAAPIPPQGEERAEVGLAISPVPVDLAGRDRHLVGLGSYFVNTIGCNSCHTSTSFAEGGNPYNGQPIKINTARFMAGGNRFGTIVSKNLTPDRVTGLPGGKTFSQFVDAMRNGTDHDQVHPTVPLLQVMPWPYYSRMSNTELLAMYEYLRAIPHADTPL